MCNIFRTILFKWFNYNLIEIKQHNSEAIKYFRIRQYESALAEYQKIVDIYRQQPYKEYQLACILEKMGNICLLEYDLDRYLIFMTESTEIFISLDHITKGAEMFVKASQNSNYYTEHLRAIKYMEQAIEIYKISSNSRSSLADCMIRLGKLYFKVGKTHLAAELLEDGAEILHSIPLLRWGSGRIFLDSFLCYLVVSKKLAKQRLSKWFLKIKDLSEYRIMKESFNQIDLLYYLSKQNLTSFQVKVLYYIK